MYVCICHKVTDRDIYSAVNSGCCSLRTLQEKTCLGTQCGNCVELAEEILSCSLSQHPGNSVVGYNK